MLLQLLQVSLKKKSKIAQNCNNTDKESFKMKECPGLPIINTNADCFLSLSHIHIIFYVFTSVQLIANGQSSPVVMRPVVKESKQDRLMYNQTMVAKIVTALTQRVAK